MKLKVMTIILIFSLLTMQSMAAEALAPRAAVKKLIIESWRFSNLLKELIERANEADVAGLRQKREELYLEAKKADVNLAKDIKAAIDMMSLLIISLRTGDSRYKQFYEASSISREQLYHTGLKLGYYILISCDYDPEKVIKFEANIWNITRAGKLVIEHESKVATADLLRGRHIFSSEELGGGMYYMFSPGTHVIIIDDAYGKTEYDIQSHEVHEIRHFIDRVIGVLKQGVETETSACLTSLGLSPDAPRCLENLVTSLRTRRDLILDDGEPDYDESLLTDALRTAEKTGNLALADMTRSMLKELPKYRQADIDRILKGCRSYYFQGAVKTLVAMAEVMKRQGIEVDVDNLDDIIAKLRSRPGQIRHIAFQAFHQRYKAPIAPSVLRPYKDKYAPDIPDWGEEHPADPEDPTEHSA